MAHFGRETKGLTEPSQVWLCDLLNDVYRGTVNVGFQNFIFEPSPLLYLEMIKGRIAQMKHSTIDVFTFVRYDYLVCEYIRFICTCVTGSASPVGYLILGKIFTLKLVPVLSSWIVKYMHYFCFVWLLSRKYVAL